MSNDARFSIIPGWIVTDRRLKGRDLQVLCLLGRHADKQGWCWRSQVKMAVQLDCARSTVQASIDRLVDIGVVEKHIRDTADGRDTAHLYRVIYDRAPPSGYDFDAYLADENEENAPIDGASAAHPPADISAPPADPASAPPAGSGSAPIKDPSLTPPEKRYQREARERGHSVSENAGEVNAAIIKRVQKFCTGTGYRQGEWPQWSSSTIGYIAQKFAKLTPEQQDAACEGRDVFLAKCKRDRVVKPMPVANYFRDMVWEMLTDADRSAYAGETAGHVAATVVNGRMMAPTFGPLWAVARFMPLLNGPVLVETSDRDVVRSTYETAAKASYTSGVKYAHRKGLSVGADGSLIFPDDFERREYERTVLVSGYPEVNRLHDAARDREQVTVDAVFDAAKDLAEPVKVGSDLWIEWREWHERENMPFVPDPGRFPVVYFPKGGPAGLREFETAARAAMRGKQGDDDAA